MITPEEDRRQRLISANVPAQLLDAINVSSECEDLEFIICYPKSAYHYLSNIQDQYAILLGYEITPIFDGCNGDTCSVMLTKGSEILDDFGSNFEVMFANLVIEYYEFSELTLDELIKNSKKLGFDQANILLEALSLADVKRERETFDNDRKWRNENLPRMIKNEI